MNEKLIECITEYRDYTLLMIDATEKGDYDCVEEYLNKRQKTIDDINQMNCSKAEFVKSAEKFGLEELEKQLEQQLNAERDNIKHEMANLKSLKDANNSYNSKFYGNAKIFSKKI